MSKQGISTHGIIDDYTFSSEEVKHALLHKLPVVALESTIITHGMPYPQNLETALLVENDIRRHGAIPATIAIVKGRIRIGLTQDELRDLAVLTQSEKGRASVMKCSIRDLPIVISTKMNGSTTVAATMWIAYRAGIRVFVTGGIGGVHREVSESFDISADLKALADIDVSVICAGVKSILDIPKTLEYLETMSVPVLTLETDEFPAFFSRHSGSPSPCRVNSIEEISQILRTKSRLGFKTGTLIAVPIPERHSADPLKLQGIISQALDDSKAQGIHGKHVTPFLLSRVEKLSEGLSLQSNIALIRNNAMVGAQLSTCLSKTDKAKVVVIGGSSVDLLAMSSAKIIPKTSNPGIISTSFGGVGRNIAEALARLGSRGVVFLTVVGKDHHGSDILAELDSLGVDTSYAIKSDTFPTPSYLAVSENHSKDLEVGIADFSALNELSSSKLLDYIQSIGTENISFVVIDGNLDPESIRVVCSSLSKSTDVWFEPISVAKCVCCSSSLTAGLIDYISPNVDELFSMASSMGWEKIDVSSTREKVKSAAEFLMQYHLKACFVTMGADGVFVVYRDAQSMLSLHVPAVFVSIQEIIDSTGAGDCFVAGCVHGILSGFSLRNALNEGIRAATSTLKSSRAVSPKL